MPKDGSDDFIGFNPRSKDSEPPKPNTPSPIQYSSPTSQNGEITGFTVLFLWGGIPIALLGFGNFGIFMIGLLSTSMAFLKIKSEADFGNDSAKGKLSSGKTALWIIGIMIPFRILFLVLIGI